RRASPLFPLPCSSATQEGRAKSSVNFKPRLATCGARQGRLQRSKSSSSNLLAELSQQTFQAVELCLQCRESFFGLRQVSLAAHLLQPQSGAVAAGAAKLLTAPFSVWAARSSNLASPRATASRIAVSSRG